MSDGKGKIVDGMSYQSTLPEAYAKVKHERDNVVEAFNKLKTRQRGVEQEHLELTLAVREFLTAKAQGDRIDDIIDTLERLV